MKIQTLDLGEEKSEIKVKEIGFWQRQFQSESTNKQKVFDWIFGVILPVICVLADPLVFRGYGLGKGALFAGIKPFAYMLSFTSIMAMIAWLIWGKKLKWLNSFLAGLFAIGSLVSLIIGIVLIPFSLLGLAFIIGILGFTPLFSSFVYARNTFRALQSAEPFFTTHNLTRSFMLGIILSFTIPLLTNLEISFLIREMNTGSAETIRLNAERLKYVYPLINFDVLGGHYCDSPNSEEHQALAEVYQRFTGEDIKRVDFHICEDW